MITGLPDDMVVQHISGNEGIQEGGGCGGHGGGSGGGSKGEGMEVVEWRCQGR